MSSFFCVLSTVEYIAFAIGLVINSFLLYCIFFRSHRDLGAYKYMQIIIVSSDVIYAMSQVEKTIQEARRFIAQDLVLVIFGLTPIANSGIVVAAFLGLYAVNYLMIDYNFLYRLWAIKSPERIRLFSKRWFVMLLTIVFIAFFFLWSSVVYNCFVPTEHGKLKMREVVMRKYDIDTMSHGIIMSDFFNADGTRNIRASIGVAILFTILGICSIFMIYSAATIVRYLKRMKKISAKSLQLQRQLFVLLCAQTLVPLIILYSPCLINIGCTFMAIDVEWFADLTALFISFFLPIDGLAILYFMKDYRQAALDFVLCRRCLKRNKNHREATASAFDMTTTF